MERTPNFGLDSILPFAPGWSPHRLQDRILAIKRFYLFSTDVIPLKRRRSISLHARALLDDLDGLGGYDAGFLETLGVLAGPAKIRTGKGGDRRSGERGLEQSVLGMLTRLFIEANAMPGSSKDGRLFRFANGVGELILGRPAPFTNDAVAAEFKRMKNRIEAEEAEKPKRRASKPFYITNCNE